jgi:origin recognition complex subunit 1
MTRRTSASSEKPRNTRTDRARRLLAGAGVAREDSDDELGFEDHPWEWIYDNISPSAERDGPETLVDVGEKVASVLSSANSRRRRQDPRLQDVQPLGKIIGARMGSFQCNVGDCVLLKAEGINEAWVGLICEFVEDDNEKAANFMWFSTQKEIRNKQKKRTDFLNVRLPYRCSAGKGN